MAHPIVMSSLGSYAAEGKLISWLKPAGSRITAGEVVAEIETEKATYEVEAAVEGILYPVAKAGAHLPLESVIGFLLREGEAVPEKDSGSLSAFATKTGSPKSEEPAVQTSPWFRISPIARRLAREHNVDLAGIAGSGPGGRIVEADVMSAKARMSANSSLVPNERVKVHARIPLTGMRGAIARRMRESLTAAASLTITKEVSAEILVTARRDMQLASGHALSYDALFVKLFADSLQEYPGLNAVVDHEAIVVLEEINVGFAVGVPGGLLVPVVHNAAASSLIEIAQRVSQLRGRALSGDLRTRDVTSGTATISNLGAYGVDAFTPILNSPESVVLGVGRIARRPIVVEDGKITAASTCVLSLTFDHRVTDGIPAAQLLEAIERRMSDPQYFSGLG